MRAWAAVAAAVSLGAAAEGIDAPLAAAGDAERGREIVVSREASCLLCHVIPGVEGRPMGDVGPSLAGVGSKLKAPELRLRIVDSSRINPKSVMPPYHRVEGLNAVARDLRGSPVLSSQQVEDVVAYLGTLK